ncbi:MAG: heavy metal-binding domain-containing protein [Bacteroidia bacterium]
MKKAILLSSAILVFAISSCTNSTTQKQENVSQTTIQNTSFDTTKLKSGIVFYQCEMNPEVISDKPGTCPKCGMTLEKVIKK